LIDQNYWVNEVTSGSDLQIKPCSRSVALGNDFVADATAEDCRIAHAIHDGTTDLTDISKRPPSLEIMPTATQGNLNSLDRVEFPVCRASDLSGDVSCMQPPSATMLDGESVRSYFFSA
jgi:hypothetical protein